ncbi:MAG: hypothetical protein WA782_10075 [Sulfitobacter sp.]
MTGKKPAIAIAPATGTMPPATPGSKIDVAPYQPAANPQPRAAKIAVSLFRLTDGTFSPSSFLPELHNNTVKQANFIQFKRTMSYKAGINVAGRPK